MTTMVMAMMFTIDNDNNNGEQKLQRELQG
jgi:hypothetical protein